jgi:lysophospholipase L1-like esterase
MLGLNDLKWEGRQRAVDARLGMARLIEITRRYDYGPGCTVPELLLMSPPHLAKTEDEDFAFYFEHAIAESRNLGYQYARLASEAGCHFFDAASVASADPKDGIHLDVANTRAIGKALVPVVKGILSL